MIAPVRKGLNGQKAEIVQDQFLTMLPLIRRQAWMAFRGRDAESRHELTQEVIANAYCAFVQLVRRGKHAVAYPTPLAQFAIRQVCAGRRVGSQLNKDDLLSPYARKIQGITIERLDRPDEQLGAWYQLLVEDRQAGPAETAAARIDVAAWLGTLSRRHRRIAKALALGTSTSDVARQFGLSAGRVSQLRSWFRRHWEGFQSGTQPGSYAV
jgi:transposase-like protein